MLSAFRDELNITDKQVIAEKLGYISEQSVYKVIKGKMELNFEALKNFHFYTKRSIDWLLTGEEKKTPLIEFLSEQDINAIEKLRNAWNLDYDDDKSFDEFILTMLRWGETAIIGDENKSKIRSEFETVEYIANREFLLSRSIIEIIRQAIINGELRNTIIDLVQDEFIDDQNKKLRKNKQENLISRLKERNYRKEIDSSGQELAPKSKKKILLKKETEEKNRKKAG